MRLILTAFAAGTLCLAGPALSADLQQTETPAKERASSTPDVSAHLVAAQPATRAAPERIDPGAYGLPLPRFGYFYRIENGAIVLVHENSGRVVETIRTLR